jgi:hypothetical protein
MTRPSLNLAKIYKIQYVHPETGEVLKSSRYLEKGVNKSARRRYLVNGEWLFLRDVPEKRERIKENSSYMRGFFMDIKKKMKEKTRLMAKGRDLIGENEFEDKFNCYDKLQAHYEEQVERYGPICPITHMEFTFERTNEQTGTGNGLLNITNLSHDRMLNEKHYTKQNTLFTSAGWNLTRRNFSLKDMSLLMREDYFKRYCKILVERFPDQIYKINELENRAKHPQERR